MSFFGQHVRYLAEPSLRPPATHLAMRSLSDTVDDLSGNGVMTGRGAGGQRVDRRVQRSQQALRDALFQLMLEKGYGEATVSDITERANVGRSTFYAHYADKDDLLQDSLRGLRAFLTDESIVPAERDGPTHPALTFALPMFLHAAEQARLFRSVMEKPSDAPVQQHLQAMLVDLVTERLRGLNANQDGTLQPVVTLQARFIVGAFLGVLLHWVVDGDDRTPQQIDRMFREMMLRGLTE